MNEDRARQWLLLVYKVPKDPTRFRTYLWRQMKTLGAPSLQQMVCLLPKNPEHESQLQRLVVKIKEFGGEAHLLTFASPSKEWEDGMITRFNVIVDEGYAEVAENEERFQDEIRRETRKEKFTFAELEDMEADREKIGREMAKVRSRDFFGARGRAEAEAQMAETARLFEDFSRKVYAFQGVGEPADKDHNKEAEP